MRKAIPTDYNGQEFRSRLEAEVAYVLDALEWEWEYEPKSFLLPGGYHYIPDFLLPQKDMWVEARGYKKKGSEQQLEAFGNQLDGSQRFLRVSNGRNKGVALWNEGNWIQAALRLCEGIWEIVPYNRGDDEIKIRASKSKVRFLRPGKSRYCKIDRVLADFGD